MVATCSCDPRPNLCRIVNWVKELKAALLIGSLGANATPNLSAADKLTQLLVALAGCVSLVHERKHELLLKELLDTPLWQVPQVGLLACHPAQFPCCCATRLSDS